MMSILSQVEAEDRLHFWQGVLGLEDWDIRIDIVRYFQMDKGSMGEVRRANFKKIADITLLDPQDYSPSFMREQDMEKTLVHELLHLHFWGSRPPGAKEDERGEERAIDAIASALVGLHRKALYAAGANKYTETIRIGGTD